MVHHSKNTKKQDELDALVGTAHFLFSDTLDFIWKNPKLIEHEFKVELEKLSVYYPNDPQSARLRWHLESKKLLSVFPILIATGNLFIATSLFENYLLKLSLLLVKLTKTDFIKVKNQGFPKIFNFLKNCGLQINHPLLWPQIDAALKVRNCLMHANGLFDLSRDEKELRRVVKSGTFLSLDDRNRMKKSGIKKYDELIVIVPSVLGDTIQIKNDYAFIVTAYYRDYFLELCKMAKMLKSK